MGRNLWRQAEEGNSSQVKQPIELRYNIAFLERFHVSNSKWQGEVDKLGTSQSTQGWTEPS